MKFQSEKMTEFKKEIRKIIYKEREIWKEAYPYLAEFINDYTNKIILEIDLEIN